MAEKRDRTEYGARLFEARKLADLTQPQQGNVNPYTGQQGHVNPYTPATPYIPTQPRQQYQMPCVTDAMGRYICR
jgi:hypothetical protein